MRHHAALIEDELNVRRVAVRTDESELVELSAKADFRVLGPRLGPKVKEVSSAIASLASVDVQRLLDGGTLTVADETISAQDVVITREPRAETVVETAGSLAVVLDIHLDEDLLVEGVARELVSRIQQLRRDAGLAVTDRIGVRWHTEDDRVAAAFAAHRETIAGEVLASSLRRDESLLPSIEVDGARVALAIVRAD